MLNLTPTPSALSTFHTRFLDGDLPDELSTAAFERFDASTYDGEVLARVAGPGSCGRSTSTARRSPSPSCSTS